MSTEASWTAGSVFTRTRRRRSTSVGIADRFVGEGGRRTVAAHQRAGGRVEDAELRFEPGARFALAGQFQHQRMRGQVDGLDLLGRDRMLLAELDAAVDRRDG